MMRNAKPVRLAILGTGSMANQHAKAFAAIDGVELVACIDTSAVRLAAFRKEYGIGRGFSSVSDALDWDEFDAVTNVTPDAAHHPTTLPFLAAKKHVLCEKPLATNHYLAEEMAAAAARAGTVNMVNLTYRNGPAMNTAAQMIADGAIGEIRHFEASYLQSWLTQPAWGDWHTDETWLWRLSTAHGSAGVLGDIGVHILDFATHIAGSDVARLSCQLKTFDKAPGGRIGDYTLDANDSAVMHLELKNGAIGVLHASRFASGHLNDLRLRIFGTKGGLDVQFEKGISTLSACLAPSLEEPNWVVVPTAAVKTNYQRFIDAIRADRPVQPDFARGALLQKVLDQASASDAAQSRRLTV